MLYKGFGIIRNGWIGFPHLSASKTKIQVQKNGEKTVATMETPLKKLGRELLSNGGVSQTDLSLATGLPSWKISRFFRRLELLKLIEVEKEPRFTRGRPRKIGRLTPSGIEYFKSLLRRAGDENRDESREPWKGREETKGDEDGQ